jgi:hypothetical protein
VQAPTAPIVFLLLLLPVALPTAASAGAVRVDSSRVQQPIGAGSMDGRDGLDVTPDMVVMEDGQLVLRARGEPWGAKTGTYVYRDVGPLDERWTLKTCLVFRSPLLEQHAGLYVGTPDRTIPLLLGRPGQPYDLSLLGTAGEKLTARPSGHADGEPLWLRLLRADDQRRGAGAVHRPRTGP